MDGAGIPLGARGVELIELGARGKRRQKKMTRQKGKPQRGEKKKSAGGILHLAEGREGGGALIEKISAAIYRGGVKRLSWPRSKNTTVLRTSPASGGDVKEDPQYREQGRDADSGSQFLAEYEERKKRAGHFFKCSEIRQG